MPQLKLTSRGAPAVVAFVVLLLILGGAARAETEVQSETQTTAGQTSSTGQQGSTELTFTLQPVPVPGFPSYSGGTGTGYIQIEGASAAVHIEAEQMAPSTRFMLSITVNGTSRSVANMTTDGEGEVEAEAVFPLGPGTYGLGLRMYDMSTFGSPTTVMESNPSAQQATVPQTSGTAPSQSGEGAQSLTTVQGSQAEDDGIRTAVQSGVIPAVVQVEDSGVTAYITDNSFSVSAGRYQQDGLVVSISARNATGPRILLVNLTSDASRSLFSHSILITLDGSQVLQASSVSQVLAAKAGDPARFVMVSTQSGLSLLVSIPHFSYHVIEILPIPGGIGAILLVDLPVLLISLAVVSVVVVSMYARRVRLAV